MIIAGNNFESPLLDKLPKEGGGGHVNPCHCKQPVKSSFDAQNKKGLWRVDVHIYMPFKSFPQGALRDHPQKIPVSWWILAWDMVDLGVSGLNTPLGLSK